MKSFGKNMEKFIEKLSDVVEKSDGVSSSCPNCGKDNSKFMVFAPNGYYTGHNCFSCGFKGGGHKGQRMLAATLGVQLDIELNEWSQIISSMEEVDDSVEPIEWPPDWVSKNKNIEKYAVNFLKKRGFPHPFSILDFYEDDILFSEVVSTGEGKELFYPSIISVSRTIEGEAVGWSARRIDEFPVSDYGFKQKNADNMPKSLVKPGRNWKKVGFFGVNQLNFEFPVVSLVEGFFDSLATPNSLAMNGKHISVEAIEKLSQLAQKHDLRRFILALDRDVYDKKKNNYKKSEYEQFITPVIDEGMLLMPDNVSFILFPWEKISNAKDPGELGRKQMTAIIFGLLGLSKEEIALPAEERLKVCLQKLMEEKR